MRNPLKLHSFARQRTLPPTAATITPAPPLEQTPAVHARNRQTRLTTIWQMTPPHPRIADSPAPCPAPRLKQQQLMQYVTALTATTCSSTVTLPPTSAPDEICSTPRPSSALRTHRRRRSPAAYQDGGIHLADAAAGSNTSALHATPSMTLIHSLLFAYSIAASYTLSHLALGGQHVSLTNTLIFSTPPPESTRLHLPREQRHGMA